MSCPVSTFPLVVDKPLENIWHLQEVCPEDCSWLPIEWFLKSSSWSPKTAIYGCLINSNFCQLSLFQTGLWGHVKFGSIMSFQQTSSWQFLLDQDLRQQADQMPLPSLIIFQIAFMFSSCELGGSLPATGLHCQTHLVVAWSPVIMVYLCSEKSFHLFSEDRRISWRCWDEWKV